MPRPAPCACELVIAEIMVFSVAAGTCLLTNSCEHAKMLITVSCFMICLQRRGAAVVSLRELEGAKSAKTANQPSRRSRTGGANLFNKATHLFVLFKSK